MARCSVTLVTVFGLAMAGALSVPIRAQQDVGAEQANADEQQETRYRLLRGQFQRQLGGDEDELFRIIPQVDKVFVLKNKSRAGGVEGMPGASDANPMTPSPLETASRDFRRAVADKNSSEAEIQAKLKILREEKAKMKAELAKAQAELKAVVNPREEAVFVLHGFLE